jgi:HEAT repeat protein
MPPSDRIEQALKGQKPHRLCRLLRHRDAQVRRRAAQALGQTGDPEAVLCLARALSSDRDEFVRRWAVEALARIGGGLAVDALVQAAFSARPEVVRLATHALSTMDTPEAATALRLRDMLFRNEQDALEGLGRAEARLLGIILDSEQYRTWPSARRNRILTAAVALGVTPPAQHRNELAEMGLFVSGVHTVDDLLRGLGHRNPKVRLAAARRLGLSGQRWVTWLLYRRFKREVKRAGDHHLAAALVRAMDMLDDPRATDDCRTQLYTGEDRAAADAARILAEAGTTRAIETLFWFVAKPPPPPAFQNTALVASLLEQIGPDVVDVLRPLLADASPSVRSLVARMIIRINHPDRVFLLGVLCKDAAPAIRQSALDALSALASAESTRRIFELAGELPREQALRALAASAHPDAVGYVREVEPGATVVYGELREDNGQPASGAQVQVLQERLNEQQDRYAWQPAGPRVVADSDGRFALAVLDYSQEYRARLKIARSRPARSSGVEALEADLALTPGAVNHVQARIDRFFNRLIVTVTTGD